jgi:hypothetical protein
MPDRAVHFHLRRRGSHVPPVLLPRVVEVSDASGGRPPDRERHDRGSRYFTVAEYRVLEVVKVLHVHVGASQRSRARSEIDLDVAHVAILAAEHGRG